VVIALGFGALVFDGYDLIVYGSAVPHLLQHPEWQLSPAEVGTLGSMALFGMFFGAVGVGAVTNRIGRRRAFIGCLVWFSLMMLAVAAAPTPELLGVARFLAGLGFGGIAPVAIALVVEYAPPGRRSLYNAVMCCGFPAGGVFAAIAGITLLEPFGFRALFALGGISLVTLVPLAFFFLPESTAVTAADAAGRDRARLAPLLRGRSGVALVLFAVANVAGFLLVFGLNTWLPQLMRQAGYPLQSAITFLLVFNLGAVFGGLAGSALADRWGARWVATGAFCAGVISIGLLAFPLPTFVLYTLIAIAGGASVGTQIVVFGYVALHFGAHHRAAALGITTGFGRLGSVAGPTVGGFLVSSGVGFEMNFLFFSGVALLGAIAVLSAPGLRAATAARHSDAGFAPGSPATAT
jgi:AAHS family benzoate transporter-like MFS transporter